MPDFFMIIYNVFKDMVIPIIAAAIGGLITFYSVVLTIKKSDKDRQDDEIKKARPLFSFHGLRIIPELDPVMQHVCISDSSEFNKYDFDVYVELVNSNLSSFEIKRIFHDNAWVCCEGNTVVLPNDKCLLNFKFSEKHTCIFLEIEDVLLIKHYYNLLILPIGLDAGKVFYTLREIKNISKNDMEKIIKESL